MQDYGCVLLRTFLLALLYPWFTVFGQDQLAVAQAETARLRAAAVRAAAEKTGLEQSVDELEAKCRAAIASDEDSRYSYGLLISPALLV